MPGRIQPEESRPYFFLSYARSPFKGKGTNPDRWVTKFYDDLCEDVAHLTGTSVPGFMDHDIRLGTSWPDGLVDALANCRVFVALFSPPYFRSEYCGKEWAAFLERTERQVAALGASHVIIPAIWVPMRTEEMPSMVHSMQHITHGFPDLYKAEGLYGIIKVSRFRDRYRETVLRLAKIIKNRAIECTLPADMVPDLESLRSPFAESPPAAVRHRVRLTLAAQCIDQLPPNRAQYYYGRTVREWTPYRSQHNTTPIAAFAEQVLSGRGHHTTVDSIDEPAQNAADAPGVLIVDPWVTQDPDLGDQLRERDQNPTNLLAPFNAEDRETMDSAAELTAGLTKSLHRSIALSGSAKRIPTIDAFRDALSKAVGEAINRYFKTTQAFPPATRPTIRRPRLKGPNS